MNALPVLMVTQDNSLWGHWQEVDSSKWLPARAMKIEDAFRWKDQGRQLVFLDQDVNPQPDWSDPKWLSLVSQIKLVVFSGTPRDDEGRKYMSANAAGYAHKYSTHTTLNNILQSISEGSIWLGRSLLQKLLVDINDRLPPVQYDWQEKLSNRESAVARLAAIGKSNAEIATELDITERTVRAHLSAVFEKIDVQDRLMLALKFHGIN